MFQSFERHLSRAGMLALQVRSGRHACANSIERIERPQEHSLSCYAGSSLRSLPIVGAVPGGEQGSACERPERFLMAQFFCSWHHGWRNRQILLVATLAQGYG